ncbi:MAG: patatin-like phospholipase family protein, partial [Rubripirellula sp.]
MHRYGLALSGGGFRAALYHLGVVRYLRDAGMLKDISQITSVSGGSVFGAHLVLNWDRYCGTDEEFQRVSDELIHFLQMDVRNRIVRRFPLASAVNWGRRTLRLNTWRQYTRAGLLEQHYEKYLYGDRGLFSLPESPRLYILATDLSEGSLCAFYRDGLLLQRRTAGGHDQFDKVQVGLATVPMAVAASSAFPGFFPPLELRGNEVGAKEGEFARHAFTDGGIYDNLGLRMFRHLRLSSIRDAAEFSTNDVLNRDSTLETLARGADCSNDTALGNLWRRLISSGQEVRKGENVRDQARLAINNLGEVIQSETLYLDPAFEDVELGNDRAQSLLDEMRSSKNAAELSDIIWLNQQLVAALLEKEAGKPCLRSSSDGIDGIFVSNAGASFKVRSDGRAGGLMATAMRSSDILMDRVNQLELESFYDTSGVLFFPITQIVEPSQDPLAPHREVQRHAALIRTDMDRFTDLEVSALVQHGYCVARHQCSSTPELSYAKVVEGPPWNPLGIRDASKSSSRSGVSLSDDVTALDSARRLQRSASRRIFSTLLSVRDWPTYIWAPLLITVVFTLPYMLYRSKQTALQQSYVLAAVAETSPLYRKILQLLESGPIHQLPDVAYEDVEKLDPVDFSSVEAITDDRIFDLRGWSAGEET